MTKEEGQVDGETMEEFACQGRKEKRNIENQKRFSGSRQVSRRREEAGCWRKEGQEDKEVARHER